MSAFRKCLASRRFKFGVIIFVGLYFAGYLWLSLDGHYQRNVVSLKQLGLTSPFLGLSDRDEWQAKSLIVTTWPHSHLSVFANPLGYFFLPAVHLDRLVIHRTQFYDFWFIDDE
jgi:hypothetical protein